MPPAMEQGDDDGEWRQQQDEDEASSAQSIPLFALSLLHSDSLFSIPAAAAVPMDDPAAAATGRVSSSPPVDVPGRAPAIAVEPCSKNEENDQRSKGSGGVINQCGTGGGGVGGGGKKIRSKNWTRLEMLKLISLRAELEPRFSGGGKKTELWEEIGEALNREGIVRDGQQCRDKWEKLCAGYKEVRDSIKPKEDFVLYDVLYPILSGKMAGSSLNAAGAGAGKIMDHSDHPGHVGQDQSFASQEETVNIYEDEVLDASAGNAGGAEQVGGGDGGATAAGGGGGGGSGRARKKRKMIKYVPIADVAVVQSLVETVMAKQQRFFRELLESMERREQVREQMRQEREDQWRAEDRAQRAAFNNAMIYLAQTLVGNDKVGTLSHQQQQQQQRFQQPENKLVSSLQQQQPKTESFTGVGAKKRSKNWKRAEVLQLIKLRGEMDAQFSSGTRRAAVWEELSEALMAQGIHRDGKQCREKWDKLTAAYKDVTDGVKEPVDMPYFAELSAALKKPVTLEAPPLAVAVTE